MYIRAILSLSCSSSRIAHRNNLWDRKPGNDGKHDYNNYC